jgi:endonuclease-3
MARTDAKRLKLKQMLIGLVRMYGEPKPLRISRGAGLDTLIAAMLSQNTNMINATRGYRMLRRRFKSWTEVMNADVSDVQREIAICGLARMRARRLQNLLRVVKARHGKLSIDHLISEPIEDAFTYLMSFYGIGPKTAAFTMLFGFGHAVLPVDNGVLRVVRRLRLVRPNARDMEAERVLSPLIETGQHYATHVLLFQHAKERCRPRNPKCRECELLKICPFGQRRLKHQPVGKEELIEQLQRARTRKRELARFASAGISKNDDERETNPVSSMCSGCPKMWRRYPVLENRGRGVP